MLQKSVLSDFKKELNGRLIQPGDPEYDTARSVWNGMIDKRPAAIARCADPADVVAAVKYARENNLQISVKAGGHGVAGKAVCNDGLMVDMSKMKSVKVDSKARTAKVDAGATMADLDTATQKHGLAVTGGIVSETGVAGLTLGGGVGYLARKYGLTIDNLLSVDMVAANGEVLRASETENPDLFWGLRGGGGNFGIVTSFEFQLHKVGPDIANAQIFYPFDDAERVLKGYRDLMSEAPDELACYALAVNIPPADPFPDEYRGKTAVALVGCYSGDIEKGLSILEPLKKLANPIFALVSPMPYTTLQQSFDAGVPKGARYYWKSHNLNKISDDVIDTFIEMANPLPGPLSLVSFESMGGAIGRVNPNKTAFFHRDAAFGFGIWSGWTDPADDDKNINWTRNFHKAITPYSTGGVYINYLDHDDGDQVKAALGTGHERLRKIKAKYDPDNFFCLNHNIEP